jgi:hypothetical protein
MAFHLFGPSCVWPLQLTVTTDLGLAGIIKKKRHPLFATCESGTTPLSMHRRTFGAMLLLDQASDMPVPCNLGRPMRKPAGMPRAGSLRRL